MTSLLTLEMDDVCRVDTKMEMLASPTSVSVSETSPSSPGSHGPLSPAPSKGKRMYRTQKYNRSTVKMENYLAHNPDKITAKEYRVLIPQMFQATQYPRREINRTKVKGLWDKSAQPHDWPTDLCSFRDPNNHPKYSKQESIVVFEYLRDKLRKVGTVVAPHTPGVKVETPAASLPTVKEEPMSPSQTGKAVFGGPLQGLPNLPAFHRSDNHSQVPAITSQREALSARLQLNSPPVMAVPPMRASDATSIPIPVQDMEEAAKAQGVQLVKSLELEDGIQSLGTLPQPMQMTEPVMAYDGGDSLMSRPQAVKVITPEMSYQEVGGDCALTTLSNAVPPTDNHQVISVIQDEGEGQALHPQSLDTHIVHSQSTDASIVSNTVTLVEDVECVEYARTIEESLVPCIEKFGQKFENNEMVMTKLQMVLIDTYKPLYELAKTCKSTCAELSKLAGRLQEMLRRFTYFSNVSSPEDIVKEIDNLRESFEFKEVVICSEVPQVAQEVCVMHAQSNYQPVLQHDPRDHYIPTISELEQRAKQKEADLQSPLNSTLIGWNDEEKVENEADLENLPVITQDDWKDVKQKVGVQNALSPMCQELEQMNIDEVPETFGVKLKESRPEDPVSSESETDINLQELMNDLDFLNNAGTTIMESMGIDARLPEGPELVERAELKNASKPAQIMTKEEDAEDKALFAFMAAAEAKFGDGLFSDIPHFNQQDLGLSDTLDDLNLDLMPDTNVTTNIVSLPENTNDVLNKFPQFDSDSSCSHSETPQVIQSPPHMAMPPQAPLPQTQPSAPAVMTSSPPAPVNVALTDALLRRLQAMQHGVTPMIPTTVLEAASRSQDEETPHKKNRRRFNAPKTEPYKGSCRNANPDHGRGRYGKQM